MRDNFLIAGLLACGVTALPQAAQAPTEEMLQLLEEALPPIPNVPPKVPENPLPVLPENDTGTADVDVCQLPFETAEEGQSSWDSSGAEEFLSQYITSHGVDGWANHILKDTVSGGLQGQTFDCENIQEISSCSLPMDRSCETYDPPEAYFVHISIANLNSLLHTLYLTLIDEELDDFVSKAEEIEDAFGSPEEEGLFAILIGSFVMGAAAAGPMWVAGAPMTAFVGILNVAAGAAANGGDVTEDLETTIKVTYTRFRDYIEATSKAIMSGDFTALGGHVDDYLAFITDSFSAGQMMVVDKKNLAADTYLASFGKWLVSSLLQAELSLLPLSKDTYPRYGISKVDDTGALGVIEAYLKRWALD